MTDMRNFDTTPSNDIRAGSAFVDSGDVIVKDRYTLEESGEGLGQFHRSPDELETGDGRSKVIGALVVALMLGAAGAYVYSVMPAPDVVADADLPRPQGPGNTAALTPPPPVTAPEMTAPEGAANTQAGDSLATAPADTNLNEPQPVTPSAAPAQVERQAATPRMTPAPTRTAQAPVTAPAPADPTPLTASPTPAPSPAVAPPVTPAMPQNQAASTVPEPVSPTPPASAIAGNPPLNEQSAAPAEAQPEPVQPASPAAPEATPSAPAQPVQ